MPDNSYDYPKTLTDNGHTAETGDPAVSYPTAAPAADPNRVYESVPEPKAEEPQAVSKVGRAIYKILRIILYIAYIGWAVLTCIRLWSELPGKALLQHVIQYASMLLAPAVVVDIFLRIIRRIAYGRRAVLMKRDRWALTGLILILALVFVVWMVLWKYVVKELAGL